MPESRFVESHVTDDYSGVVAYLAGLFAVKRTATIAMDRYNLRYVSSAIQNGKESVQLADFPDKINSERVSSITLELTVGDRPEKWNVQISWGGVSFSPEFEKTSMDDFLALLDRSTFRYF